MYLCWKLKTCKKDVNNIEFFYIKRNVCIITFNELSFFITNLSNLNCILYKQVEHFIFVGFTGMEKIMSHQLFDSFFFIEWYLII
jgi:hypothetical protein